MAVVAMATQNYVQFMIKDEQITWFQVFEIWMEINKLRRTILNSGLSI